MSSEQQVEEASPAPDQQNGQEAPETAHKKSLPLSGKDILMKPSLHDFITHQSVPVGNEEHVRRSPRVKDGELFGTLVDGVYTVHEMFMHGYGIDHNAQCAGWRPKNGEPYKWASYQEVYEKVCRVGSGLVAKGAKTNLDQFIGIYSKNNLAWLVMDRVCAAYSMISVPLYDTLGPEALVHIVTQCELGIILVDTNSNAKKILNDAKSGKTSTIKTIILVEDPNEDVKSLAGETSIEVITLDELEEAGKHALVEFVPPKPDDLYTICYTSGTTGAPKGVMHTHKNVVALASAFLVNSSDYFYTLTPDDVLLSFLPLAHVFERYIECGVLMHGAKIGFYQGDPKLLMEDAAELKPTIFPMVPRLINRIYGKIMAAVGQSAVRKFLFNFCLNRKMAALKKGSVTDDTFWDKIIFKKFQAVVGGRVKLSITAAAPISAEVLNVVRCVLGIPIMEGYGQTESTSGFTVTVYGDFAGGNVGSILPNMTVKLVDVPEKDYFVKNNQGEVCCKGLSVFKGYYKNEEKTKETIDEDGWLHTGDIGEWLPNGALKIIDRRKNIFKLSQGEYIAPEKIEQIYEMSEAVNQVYVHGESLKSSLVGVIVPQEESIHSWCKDKGINVEGKSFAEICEMPELSKAILEDINKTGKAQGLKSFEMVRNIVLTSEAFTVENEMLTPTLKSRRAQIQKRFQEDIDKIYANVD